MKNDIFNLILCSICIKIFLSSIDIMKNYFLFFRLHMARISKAKKARRANLQKAIAVNRSYPRQLRNRQSSKLQRTKTSKISNQAKKISSSQSSGHAKKAFNRAEHLKKCVKIRTEKASKKQAGKKNRIRGIKASAWTRKQANPHPFEVGFFKSD